MPDKYVAVPFTWLYKRELEHLGFDVTDVDDAVLGEVADLALAALTNTGIYWSTIEEACEEYGIPRKEDR